MRNRRVQSHEEVLGGRLAATTSFTVNRMGKHQEEKLTGERPALFSFFLSFWHHLIRSDTSDNLSEARRSS